MIGAASVPEQPGEQGEHMIRNRAVDVRFLAVECLCSAASRQMISFVHLSVDDGREQFMDTWQPFRSIFSILSQWLAEHELSPIRKIRGIDQ